MNAGIVFTSYIPTALVGVNSASPTLAAEVVTGLPIPTGANPGNVFYLTEDQANQLSASAVNGSAVQTCHAGWYAVVQIDSGATTGNLKAGYIVAQKNLPGGPYLVTDVSAEEALGASPAVLLGYPTGGFTPGYFTIVQVAGEASVYVGAVSGANGDLVTYAAADNGKATVPTQSTSITYALYRGIVGQLKVTATQNALNRVELGFPFGII